MIKEKQIIIDDPDSYGHVTHLKLAGTNKEIGYELGKLAKNEHNLKPVNSRSEMVTRCQSSYMQTTYPIHYERMKGYSKAFNLNIDNTQYDFSIFGAPLGETACSAVYYPPETTKSKLGTLSRNLDFIVSDNEKAPFKKVYILELQPDSGYSSISILTMEIFGQSLEGINSEGLTVVHLADGESAEAYPDNGRGEPGVGFNEFLIVQYLLDNCANLKEAKEALLMAKHYYYAIPVHLIITDSSGESFIWEFSEMRNRDYIIPGGNEPQIITNYLISKYGDDPEKLPHKSDNPRCAFNRFRLLHKEITDAGKPFTKKDMIKINSKVYMSEPLNFVSETEQARTLMHTLYVPAKKEVQISFYLYDENGDDENGVEHRSDFVAFNFK